MGKIKFVGESETTYECKENDNIIKIGILDGEIDELRISDCLQKSFTVIGFKDLKQMLYEYNYEIKQINRE